MDFLPYTMKWLELVLRWGHVLFAILWVGNSFLFNYLEHFHELYCKKLLFKGSILISYI